MSKFLLAVIGFWACVQASYASGIYGGNIGGGYDSGSQLSYTAVGAPTISRRVSLQAGAADLPWAVPDSLGYDSHIRVPLTWNWQADGRDVALLKLAKKLGPAHGPIVPTINRGYSQHY